MIYSTCELVRLRTGPDQAVRCVIISCRDLVPGSSSNILIEMRSVKVNDDRNTRNMP